MSFNLPAASCPTPQVNTAIQFLQTAFNPIGPGTPGSPFLTGGNSSAANSTSSNFNELSAYAFLIATYGSGSFGVLNGLTLSTSSSLTLTVAAGQALVGGFAELAVDTTITVPDNTSRVWVWITAGVPATLQVVGSSLTPPTGQWTLLGNVTTSGGAITAVDYSGVVSLVNGIAQRSVADTAAPADSPSASVRLISYTQNGPYYWDGANHNQQLNGAAISLTSSSVTFAAPINYAYNVQALTATLALTPSDPNIQHLTCASGQTVTMPSNASSNFGQWFQIFNDNATIGGSAITLKDSTGVTTIATIAAQNVVYVQPIYSSGSSHWPDTATPQPIS